MDFFATILLTALALGSVLFLLSVGLSLTMGLMGVLNLAHGALFMVGAYLGAQMAQVGADFWSSAIIGGLGAGLVGLILDRGLLRHLHRRFDDQVLVTFGAIFILTNVSRWIWGSCLRSVTFRSTLQALFWWATTPFRSTEWCSSE